MEPRGPRREGGYVNSTAQAQAASYSAGYRFWLLTLLFLIAGFAFIDRVIMQTLGQVIKEDLQLTDLQLGVLGGLSFALLYSTLGLPIARLAERRSRVDIIAYSVGLFSVMAALCGFAQNFWQLFLYRVGVGIGEAGVQPPGVSLIGDHFPPKGRGRAIATMQLGTAGGAVFGAFVGGWIAQVYGWRAAIVALAVPGIVLAILFKLTLREPTRGMCDEGSAAAAATEPPPFMDVMRLFASKPAFWHMMAGLGLTVAATYGWGAFTTPYAMRVFSISVADAGLIYALIAGVAGGAGLMIAGFSIDWISRRDQRWYAWLPATGCALAAPCMLIALQMPSVWLMVVAIMFGNCFTFFYQTPTIVTMQNMVTARMRASAAFVFFFTTTLIGVGLGPSITGLLSDIYAQGQFAFGDFTSMCPGGRGLPGAEPAVAQACAAASTAGVKSALTTISLSYLWAAFHYWMASRTVRADLEAAVAPAPPGEPLRAR
jgi:predicted MFS family arabinose efflux permease